MSTAEGQSRCELVRPKLKGKPCYLSLENLKKQVEKVKLNGWIRAVSDDNLVFELWDESFALPKISVTIETSLNFSVAAFNWLLPVDHTLYKTYRRSVSHASISNIMHSIQQLQLYAGVPADVYNLVTVTPSSNQP